MKQTPEMAFEDDAPTVAAGAHRTTQRKNKVSTTDFTQLASDGKQAANLYDDSFERLGVLEVSERAVNSARMTLNRIHAALRGMAAINQILLANAIMDDCDGTPPMSQYLIGGLMSATQALTDLSLDCVETFADREQARRDADHD